MNELILAVAVIFTTGNIFLFIKTKNLKKITEFAAKDFLKSMASLQEETQSAIEKNNKDLVDFKSDLQEMKTSFLIGIEGVIESLEKITSDTKKDFLSIKAEVINNSRAAHMHSEKASASATYAEKNSVLAQENLSKIVDRFKSDLQEMKEPFMADMKGILESLEEFTSHTKQEFQGIKSEAIDSICAASKHATNASDSANISKTYSNSAYEHLCKTMDQSEIALNASRNAFIKAKGVNVCSKCDNLVARYFISDEGEVICANCDPHKND